MNCISSPSLDDWKLISYIDGEADNVVVHHMEECPFCREKADRWQKLQTTLQGKLYRQNCLSPMEMGDYHLGLLPDSQKMIMAAHLRQCPVCRSEITQLEEFMGTQDSRSDFIKSARVFIAKLISGGGITQDQTGSSLSPAFTGLRGDEDEPFIYQAGNVQIVIDVQDDVEQMGRKVLMGLVTGLESKGFMVEAYQEERIVASTFVDEIGNFTFNHFPSGTYDLILFGPDTEIRLQSFIV